MVTIIPVVIGVFGTVTKGLLKGLGNLEFWGRLETKSWRLADSFCHSNICEKPPTKIDVKISQWINNNNNNNNNNNKKKKKKKKKKKLFFLYSF